MTEDKRRYQREWKRRWRQSEANRKRERKLWRDWYGRHKDSREFREKRGEGLKRWRSNEQNRANELTANLARQSHRGYLYSIKRLYGLSPDDLLRLKRRQKFKCRLCCKRKPLHIDHDHVTGRVRGLLCGNCNRLLGFYEKVIRDCRLLRRVRHYLG